MRENSHREGANPVMNLDKVSSLTLIIRLSAAVPSVYGSDLGGGRRLYGAHLLH